MEGTRKRAAEQVMYRSDNGAQRKPWLMPMAWRSGGTGEGVLTGKTVKSVVEYLFAHVYV